MDNIRIPSPNPALTEILKSQAMRSLVQEKAEEAQAIYRAIVAKRTGNLARSARVETFLGGRHNDRWCGRLIAAAAYAASHEYGTGRTNPRRAQPPAHDLNRVLNAMGSL